MLVKFNLTMVIGHLNCQFNSYQNESLVPMFYHETLEMSEFPQFLV